MATTPNNPLGLDGFAFCEFTTPEPETLAHQFDMMGFVPTNRHPEKAITRYKQGRITLLLNAEGKFDIHVTVSGGGTTGQAGAIRLGLARALAEYDEKYKPALRRAGALRPQRFLDLIGQREGHGLELELLRFGLVGDHPQIVRGRGQFLLDLESRERERTGIANLKVEYNRVHGFYIEVTRAQSEKVPDDYRRRQTLKNAERYITPELKTFEDKALSAQDRALAREKMLYDQLLDSLAPDIAALQRVDQRLQRILVRRGAGAADVDGVEHGAGQPGLELGAGPVIAGGDGAGAGAQLAGQRGPDQHPVKVALVVGEVDALFGRRRAAFPVSMRAGDQARQPGQEQAGDFGKDHGDGLSRTAAPAWRFHSSELVS